MTSRYPYRHEEEFQVAMDQNQKEGRDDIDDVDDELSRETGEEGKKRAGKHSAKT